MAQQFGKRTKDRSADSGSGGHQHYIKTFREKRNPVTFLFDNPAEDFIEVREHWDNKNQLSYPCAIEEGADGCIGCSYPVKNEELTDQYLKDNWVDDDMTFSNARDKRAKDDAGWGVRSTSGKWLFPAIDEKGYVNIYKIGYTAWVALKEIYDELGTITDQVFTVRCSNPKDKSNTITFMPAGGDPQKPKHTVPSDSIISEALGDKYLYAYKKYVELGIYDESGMPEPSGPERVPEPETEPETEPEGEAQEAQAERPGDVASEALAAAKNQVAKKAVAKKAQPKADPPAQESDPSAPTLPKLLEGIDPTTFPDGFDPFLVAKEAKPSELKFWLDNFPPDGVEYPPNAPRGVLIATVEAAQAV